VGGGRWGGGNFTSTEIQCLLEEYQHRRSLWGTFHRTCIIQCQLGRLNNFGDFRAVSELMGGYWIAPNQADFVGKLRDGGCRRFLLSR